MQAGICSIGASPKKQKCCALHSGPSVPVLQSLFYGEDDLDGEPLGRLCVRHLQHVLPDESIKRRRRIPCRLSLL